MLQSVGFTGGAEIANAWHSECENRSYSRTAGGGYKQTGRGVEEM